MSKDDVHHPVNAPAPVQQPHPPPAPRRAAAPGLVERFQRALMPASRPEVRTARRERTAVDARLRSEDAEVETDAEALVQALPQVSDGAPCTDGDSDAGEMTESAEDVDALQGRVERDMAVVRPPMPLPGAVPVSKALVVALARAICTVYEMADPSFVTWSVQVPLPQEVLPDTRLRMVLAPHHLMLRFSTDSARSHRLVFAHRTKLVEMLIKALGTQREIDVDLS